MNYRYPDDISSLEAAARKASGKVPDSFVERLNQDEPKASEYAISPLEVRLIAARAEGYAEGRKEGYSEGVKVQHARNKRFEMALGGVIVLLSVVIYGLLITLAGPRW